MTRWAILTGEYPPQHGGVSDYTRLVAEGLAAVGDEVAVYAPPQGLGPDSAPPGVQVRRLPDRFGLRGLRWLDRELVRCRPDRVLIQYVPHAFGWKAMNLPFVAWVLIRRVRRRDDVRVMFHEVAFPWVRRPLRHNVLAAVNRVMAAVLLRACTRAYVSHPGLGAASAAARGRAVADRLDAGSIERARGGLHLSSGRPPGRADHERSDRPVGLPLRHLRPVGHASPGPCRARVARPPAGCPACFSSGPGGTDGAASWPADGRTGTPA